MCSKLRNSHVVLLPLQEHTRWRGISSFRSRGVPKVPEQKASLVPMFEPNGLSETNVLFSEPLLESLQ